MRPPRFLIVVAFCITLLFILVTSSRTSAPQQNLSDSSREQKAGIRRLLSFQPPFSLFPPNAIISLTDDNNTYFQASPAMFGPLLPAKGLSGQLWVGSGFGDDSLRQGTVTAGAEGELGCSDVPGWVGGQAKAGMESGDKGKATNIGKAQNQRRAGSGVNDRTAASDQRQVINSLDSKRPPVDDGTDDYLHHPLPGSPFVLPLKPGQVANEGNSDGKNINHADIQSIQEGAEIAGKVVILSRGGCGFLEKVKWVQRRGGIALIVGDDTKGGPLIQMYARGDTSNVTIPSVFTTYTAAHLLSSLMPSGSSIQDTIDENGKASMKVQQSNSPTKKGGKAKNHGSQPTFTPTTVTPKATATTKATTKSSKKTPNAKEPKPKPSPAGSQRSSWLKSIFGRPQSGDSGSEDSRPPSSGRLDWVLVDNWDDDDGKNSNKPNSDQSKSSSASKANSKFSQSDDFVIGVQDWRDPDLVGSSKDAKDSGKKGKNVGKSTTSKTTVAPQKQTSASGKKQAGENLEGGSITPGSGEYGPEAVTSKSKFQDSKGDADEQTPGTSATSGILSKLFGDDDEVVVDGESSGSKPRPSTASQRIPDEIFEEDSENSHEGLWVTLTPTSGASPFFDTLLVLVVSPLVTLTVVYALLLLRSRIRRRRWRAPKSVVERLPVRTFQTHVSSTSSSTSPSPRLPSSPTTSSPTTPLLQSTPTRPRPRSRTTSGAPADLVHSPSDPRMVPSQPTRTPEHEKGASVTSQWSKYMGKQVECVVCLEEYVDGVSRVMSLPCGHEFHEACITPWLTTRRRTCPICKGDVVRSLARGSPSASPSNPRYDSYHDESDGSVDVQTLAAETVNNSPTSAMPIASDLESGMASPRPRRGARRGASWRSLLSTSLGGSTRDSGDQSEEANDRSR